MVGPATAHEMGLPLGMSTTGVALVAHPDAGATRTPNPPHTTKPLAKADTLIRASSFARFAVSLTHRDPAGAGN
jgi:hypothetical protein